MIPLLRLNHVEYVLIVNEVDIRPIDPFLFIFFLLHLEYVLIEMLLKFFVGKVYAKLLK